jgi:hypothetical protein
MEMTPDGVLWLHGNTTRSHTELLFLLLLLSLSQKGGQETDAIFSFNTTSAEWTWQVGRLCCVNPV